jgi:hypothetical protein
MEKKTETPLARGAIRSNEIGYSLQKALKIEGKILIKQVRGGQIQLSIDTKDEDKLLKFFSHNTFLSGGHSYKKHSTRVALYKVYR